MIDECFIEFTKRQNESLIKTAIHSQYLIVVRAFTKIYGIPGVRLGYLAASEKMVECLKRQLPEWNVSLLAQYAGAAALQEDENRGNTLQKSFVCSVLLCGRERQIICFFIQRRIYMKCC